MNDRAISCADGEKPLNRALSRFSGAKAFFRILWAVARVPLVFLLVASKPVVDMICSALALSGILMASFFKVYGAPVAFPFLKMLVVCACIGLVPLILGGLIRLLALPEV
jgi:hypothetical protein